jgi:ribokinase
MDFSARTTRLPAVGETVLGDEFLVVPGGKGANQAVAAARLGATTALVGCVGADDLGEALVDSCRGAGVDVTAVLRDETRGTGVAQITVDATGRNLIVVVPGANHALHAADVRSRDGLIAAARVVVAQLEIPVDAVAAAMASARAAGVTTILDPAPATPLPDALLADVDLCVPNETELAMLTARPVETIAEVEESARVLLRRGCGAVVVTRGARGALFVDDRRRHEVAPFVVDAIDTTAAGDAFRGALAAAMARGAALEVALREAAAAGALASTVPGAMPALPSRAVLDELLRSA